MNLAYEMACVLPVGVTSSAALIRYSPAYREAYRRSYNECFHEMREALGIEPFDFIQDDSFFETGMDDVYLLVEGDELIGGVALRGREIDDLFVRRAVQGRGWGRQILLWALERLKTEKAVVHVAAWNERAIRLYRRIGFEIVDTIVIGHNTAFSMVPAAARETAAGSPGPRSEKEG